MVNKDIETCDLLAELWQSSRARIDNIAQLGDETLATWK